MWLTYALVPYNLFFNVALKDPEIEKIKAITRVADFLPVLWRLL